MVISRNGCKKEIRPTVRAGILVGRLRDVCSVSSHLSQDSGLWLQGSRGWEPLLGCAGDARPSAGMSSGLALDGGVDGAMHALLPHVASVIENSREIGVCK